MLFTESPRLRELECLMQTPPKYIKESEEIPMKYRNKGHQIIFTQAAEKIDRKDNALVAVLYLLTADTRLWYAAKNKVEKDRIHLDQLRPQNCSPDAYSLYCAAKDLYLGTKHMTINDLADSDVLSPTLFTLICNAMAIRRFGIKAVANNAS